MADVVVGGAGEVVYLTAGTAVATPAGQSVGTGDTAVITPDAAVGPVGKGFKGRYLLLKITESGSTADATYKVENGPVGQTPANLAIYGDSAVSAVFADGVTRYLCVDLARYIQTDGTVRILVGGGAGAALTFTAFVLDRAV